MGDQMPRLHACPPQAGIELPAPDQSGPDAGAQSDHHHRITALGRSGPVLPCCRTVRVVAQVHREIQFLLEQVPEGRVPEGHVGGLYHHPRAIIHQSGDPGSYSFQFIQGNSALLGRLDRQLGQAAHQFLRRPAPVHGAGGLVPDVSLPVHQAGH